MIKKPYYKADKIEEILEGILSIVLLGTGTLHERKAPILSGDFGEARIIILEENPLEQPTLISLEGKTIQAKGVWKRGALQCKYGDVLVTEPQKKASVEASFHETPKEESKQDLPSSTPSTKEAKEEASINTQESSLLLDKSCPTCLRLSFSIANFCWNCGFSFHKIGESHE